MTEDQLETSSSEDDAHDHSSEVSIYVMNLLAILVLWQFSFKISNVTFTALLKILKQFFVYIGCAFKFKFLHEIGDCIPLTLSTVHKLLFKKMILKHLWYVLRAIQFMIIPSVSK